MAKPTRPLTVPASSAMPNAADSSAGERRENSAVMPPLYHIRSVLHWQNRHAIFDPNDTPVSIFVALHLQNDLPPGDRRRI
ncbi:hypothetical protein K3552_00885 [Leisingera aquaemixtae]|uniref:hypothetical protein n=1 Tax=Leisingera aquaemixtae TaxID=1396826 RepID=UPI0021A75EBC|nr:hypothetical protein [Leisingera aquaemixtae]UWQ39363.1 hypothetical protein K3552_00885 [Leisingera aquaemixtae]